MKLTILLLLTVIVTLGLYSAAMYFTAQWIAQRSTVCGMLEIANKTAAIDSPKIRYWTANTDCRLLGWFNVK